MRAQTEAAIDEADISLFVVDAKFGLTPVDKELAEMLRRRGKPVVLVANKSEAKGSDGGFYDAYTLGLGEPVPISAEHGQGMLDLRDAIVEAVGEDRAYPPKEDIAETNVNLPHEMEEDEDYEPEYDDTKPLRVAIIGRPNAGKSTLISRISAARPKIADYPFTTLTPNLGVVTLGDDRSFVVADVPGLIEGAHRGLGLGHQFLRHLERTRVLIHLVDVSSASGRDAVEDLDTVRRELELFQPTLAAKPQIVAANKIDALDDEERVKQLQRRARKLRLPFFRISGVTGAGVTELLEEAWRELTLSRASSQLDANHPADETDTLSTRHR